MVFSSSLFLLYFLPLFLILYYAVPHKLKNPVILLASIFFYAWGAPNIIFMVLISIVADYLIAREMNHHSGKRRGIWLWTALIINLGLLGYYKYAGFFVENINTLITHMGMAPLPILKIILPIGISFFTFQKMSYIIDVYKGVKSPMKYVWDYALFVLFFPQLIAGPILRFNEIADQITNRRHNENTDNRLAGFYRFVIGLSKKVLIANVLGAEADKILALDYASINTLTAWTGILAYTFQIYFDFAGYSDMAIGLARMMGFVFPENFNNPYISRSITEFWRRWHITLSNWMRDYLYIPLGGNKNGKARMYINLWVVFLLSGLWHGASWNFIIWGSFHGLFLIADKLFLLKFMKTIGKYPSILLTFLITIIGWVFFRIEDMDQAFAFIKKLFAFNTSGLSLYTDNRFVFIFFLAVIFSFIGSFSIGVRLEKNVLAVKYSIAGHYGMTLLSIVLLVFSLTYIASSGFNPFIYFRF